MALLSGIECHDSVTGPKVEHVRQGMWGGDTAWMLVLEDSAHVTFQCGDGNIGAPVLADHAGGFDVQGIFYVVAGPSNDTNPRPARFTGRADQTSLELTMRLLDTGEVRGPFRMTFGREGFVSGCV